LNTLSLDVAHLIIVRSKRDLASVAEQLVHGIDGAPDRSFDRPHRHPFAKEGQDLGALG
jgi:hypothetical protein